MKLERLVGIVMILLHDRHVTARSLARRFSVSARTIQRDIDILSVAGIPVTALKGPAGGYGLMDGYTLDKTFLKKDEMKLLAGLLNGLEKLLSQAGVSGIREKINAIGEREARINSGTIRFDFMPWIPQHEIREKLVFISDAAASHKLIEIDYRDQKGNRTRRRIEPYQLVMKGYAWYVYGYCLERNEFRYFKAVRIERLTALEAVFEPRPFSVEEPFADLKDKFIDIKLKFSLNAVGRIEDYFPCKDIQYREDCIFVNTQYPDDAWLHQILLSFGKQVEVVEPVHIRKRIRDEAQEILAMYSCETAE